jgi:repressor LexA
VKLSSRQERIVDFIRDFLEDNGYPPTIREIGKSVGISSTSVVNYNLNVLERKGLLVRGKEVARGLRLVGEAEPAPSVGSSFFEVPILGTIAAGEPLFIPDDSFSTFSASDHETISLAQDAVAQGEGVYALRVKGDSMIDALVNDGDIVVLRHQERAENGDMVAAWIKDREETTLKRFYLEGDRRRVRLQPANPTMDPIFVDADNVEIRGKVMVVIRHLN